MAKRRFALPRIEEITKEQENVRELPLEGTHLVIGGPGTGKSVMALLRAIKLHSAGVSYCFLLYNHSLRQATEQLSDGLVKCRQWESWLINLYRQVTNEEIPRLAPERGKSYEPLDWSGIVNRLEKVEGDASTLQHSAGQHLIIDEGQDMPPAFYEALLILGFENIFVMADQHQQIIDGENSSRQDLENSLDVNTADVLELTRNHRNVYSVARLAQEFFTGGVDVPLPDLPPAPQHNVSRPLVFTYRQEQFVSIMKRLLILTKDRPSMLVGIFCPSNKVREKYYEKLQEMNREMPAEVSVSTYSSGRSEKLRFDEGGLIVINAQSCKGLEFDAVFLADIDQHYCTLQNRDQTKRLFYVMTTRAIDRLLLLQCEGRQTLVTQILPQDTTILERKP